jgi:hypothetical protein
MTLEFAAAALVGGHFGVVRAAIWDIEDKGARNSYAKRLEDKYAFLIGDEEAAAVMIRQLLHE